MKPLNRAAIVGYGAGDAANSMIISTANMFLLVYYTDVAGIGAAAAGTLLVVARVFNAFTDIAAGRIVDRFHSPRWGKFRPFLIFGFIPLVLGVAVFHVPDVEPSLKLLYAYCTYFLVCLAYSLVNVPYGCLVGAMTQDPRDRARLAGARTIGGLSVGATLGFFVAPLLGGGGDVQQIFTVMTLVFAVLGSGLYVFTGIACRERVAGSVPKITWRQTIEALRVNSPLVVLCLASVLLVTGNSATVAAQFYYLRDVLSRLDLFPLMAATQVVITLALAVLMPRPVAKWGKKAVFTVGCLLGAAGGLVVFLVPAEAPWPAVAGMVLAQLSAATISILTWALIADTVEYGEWKTGVRVQGINYALLAATRKLGMGFGGGLVAFALAWGGYSSSVQEQAAPTLTAIRAAAGLLPAALVLAAVVIMSWYRLTDQKHAELVAGLQESR
ncbi:MULTISPECIES: glycoside-pentoside-hexuronide (GPH):cation symporter [unclassified Arthrobacter]|uniref:glycoside-pentoside-hexuronide (GPH):cation symporter n=1 Tax=unclassified Arthrobacter TaxID=235627 RepID=UPI001EFF6C1A|nr:glycoside-pentoside-hexuronide (GPH):cation symporter [Arthrobacter sp. FW306-07-I]UKA74753.1 glycoside-pentoside-hexuronide (GPH):cation symporter [Arthrobacter sp. FW306-07-I]